MKKVFPYLFVLFLASAVRAWWAVEVVSGPMSELSRIDGLDMKTHLELGRLFARGESIFTPYRALCGALSSEYVKVLGFQYAAGVLLALLMTWAALTLWGKCRIAVLSGVFGALYGPELVYESITLPESLNAFFIFAAAAAALLAAKKKFSAPSLLLGGAAAGLAAVGRPATLLFAAGLTVFLLRHAGKKRFFFVLAGVAAVFVPIGIYHFCRGFCILPFYGSNLAYIAEVGQRVSPGDLNASGEGVAPLRFLGAAFAKLPSALGCVQTPNNINYGFLREHFFPAAFAIGPELLYVAGWSGVFLWLFRRRFQRFEGVMIFSCVALTLPLAAFQPLGRYKLMIFPFLSLAAACFLGNLLPVRNARRRAKTLLCALICGIFLGYRMPGEMRRTADYLNWGVGCARKGDGRELYFFRTAFEARPELPRAAELYARSLLRYGDAEGAQKVILLHREALTRRGGDGGTPR